MSDHRQGPWRWQTLQDQNALRAQELDDKWLSISRTRKRNRGTTLGTLQARLEKHLEVVKKDGLHVRVLVMIVAEMEPVYAHYLPNESALEGPVGVGDYILHGMEEVESQMASLQIDQ